MVISKETLSDIKEKFEKAYKLVNEESKNDPITDPYRSHYSAREVLIEIMENLKNSIHSEEDNTENQFIYKVILAFVYKDLGRIYIFTEETSTGEKYLHNCIDILEEYKLKSESVVAYLGALNELGIVWSNRLNDEESKNYLTRAEDVYNEFKKLNLPAMAITDVFGTADEIEKDKGNVELEKLYTLTTFYIAQILGHLGDLERSAQYCYKTLRRQLEANDYESIDWALNAATLSQYFITPNRFKESRHHLAAATYILNDHETKMITSDMTEEVRTAVQENFKHRYADIARCWAKYGLGLLSSSRDRLMAEDSKDEENEDDKLQKNVANMSLADSSNNYKFVTLDLTAFENGITDQFCLTFDDAKLVSDFVIMWLDRAKEYYRVETEATEYAKIISDYADLYKYLAFFDDIPANQSKLHKKRCDLLEDLLKQLNRNYYLAICRECWYDCGFAYSAMLDVKLDALAKLKINETPTPHALHKINTLCDKAIKHFQEFIDSFKTKDTDTLQSNISNDEMQTILYSYFYIGRLFYKIITPDKRMQLTNLQNSLKFYKTFVIECESHPEASSMFKGELGVCKEMVSLLPHKIQRVLNEVKEL